MKRFKLYYGVCLALMLVVFSIPWTTDSNNVPSITYRGEGWGRVMESNKVMPGPLSEYVIGREPYTGWDLLPLTIPCVLAFGLGILALFVKRGSLASALAAGILMFPGVLFAGLAGAPIVITTWGGGGGNSYTIYGTGRPLFELSYWFALLISTALLIIPIAKIKMDKRNRT